MNDRRLDRAGGMDLQRVLLSHQYRVPQEPSGILHWSKTTRSVFDRTWSESSGKNISDGLYNFLIGLVLCWGFVANWLIVTYVPCQTLIAMGPVRFLVGYFASCLLGVFLFASSERPLVSFVGYNLVVVPFGLVVNLVVHRYDPALVVQAIRVTGLVTATLMLIGSLIPAFFQRIGSALSLSLLTVILWELIERFCFHVHHGVIDWVVVVIFCGYIGVDWGRANRIPCTVDNAVDSAAALYMDIINLFLRILRILGRRR